MAPGKQAEEVRETKVKMVEGGGSLVALPEELIYTILSLLDTRERQAFSVRHPDQSIAPPLGGGA
jgi:hypothetical protein